MVDLVYGRIGPDDTVLAIAKPPGGAPLLRSTRDATVTDGVTNETENRGTDGMAGTAIAQAAIVNSVETPQTSTELVVPSPGIEPGTRGFSVRCSTI
jgi:hypothetical protein